MKRLTITAERHIPLASLAALTMARELGFAQVPAYALATAVSEMAANLVFHADTGGILTLRPISELGRSGIEAIAVDAGPGIPDLDLALRDGWSSRGSLGGGLPGIRRLMDAFEIQSAPGQGTRILARKWLPCTR